MAGLVYLDLWLGGYKLGNMLRYWERVIQEFPAARVSPGIRSLAIYPLSWSETPVLEQGFRERTDPEQVIGLAHDFLHQDYAYEAQMNWDLWVPKDAPDVTGAWQRNPALVSVACFGSEFDLEGLGDRGNLQINFGRDSAFLLAEEELTLPGTDSEREMASLRIGENIQQLVGFVRRLEKKLPLTKRLLWSESGENLAEKIQSVWKLES